PEAGPRASAVGLAAVLRGGQGAAEMRRDYFLRQCLRHPFVVAKVDRLLAGQRQQAVGEADFNRPDDRALWRFVQRQAARWPVVAAEDLWDSLDDDFLRTRVQTLLSSSETPEPEPDRLPGRLVLSVLDWRLERLRGLMEEVEALFQQSQREEDAELLAVYSQQLRELPLQVLGLHKARGAMSAVVRWEGG
ncbi:MAG: hypothetical protein ACRDHL_06775, partial [Candidatus Promineifilaceae bacterium]